VKPLTLCIDNPLGFLVNKKEERVFLDVSFGSQMETVSLDDEMNLKSVGNVTKRDHGVDAVTKSFPIQRVAGDATVTTQRIPASQVTMMDAHLSCVRPDRTMETEALEPHIRTFPSAQCIAAGPTVLLLSFLHCAMSDHDPLRESDTASLRSSTHIDIKHEPTHSPDVHPTEAPQPSIKLLFSFLTPRRKLVLLAPAVASSIAAGGIAPFMTYVVGRSFNAFAAFPLTPNPPQSAKDDLLYGVDLAAIELVALGFAALVMSSFTNSLWIWTGEHNVV